MATKTQAQVATEARNKLYELGADRFTNAMLYIWINEGVADAVRRTECNRATDTQAVVSGTQEYPGPDDAVRVHMVTYTATGSDRVSPLEYNDYQVVTSQAWTSLTSAQGTPEIFWTWGYAPALTIGLYPTPSLAGTLSVHYYRFATPLATDGSAASTSIDVPQGWEDAIVDYVVRQAFIADRDERYKVFNDDYERKLAALLETAIRYTDQAGVISTATGGIPRYLWDFDYD